MSHEVIATDQAPKAIGSYSQAIAANGLVFLSGQIPLDPATNKRVQGSFEEQLSRVLSNFRNVAEAAGGNLADVVKLTIYLTDLANYPAVNDGMAEYFEKPFPARAVVGVASLPLDAPVEVEGIMITGSGAS